MNHMRTRWQVQDRISATEVAELAGVGPSAVSNWRKRHSDFPLALGDSAAGAAVFAYEEILSWLQRHGKEIRTAHRAKSSAFWQCAEALRGTLHPAGALELLLQLLVLRRESVGQLGLADEPVFDGAWRHLLDGKTRPDRFLAYWSTTVGRHDHNLGRALRPQHGLKDLSEEQVEVLLRVVDDTVQENNEWGRVATDILREFNRKLGKQAEFATHVGLENLMIGLLRPIDGSVLDPACGVGMLLARAWVERESDDVLLYGQEVAEGAWRLGYLHLRLLDASFQVASGDTLRDDRFWALKADRVVLHPPFGSRLSSDMFSGDDPRWSLGVPTSATSDFAWTQHLLHHIADGGVGVMTTPARTVSATGRAQRIKAAMVQTDLLDAVIQLPTGLSYLGPSAAVLLLFQRGRPGRERRVLFIDGRQLGTPQRGAFRYLSRASVDRVVDTVAAWRSGVFDPQPQFSAYATHDRIAAQDWYLGPGRYIRYTQADTGIVDGGIVKRWARVSQDVNEQLRDAQSALPAVQALLSRVAPRGCNE